MLVIVRIFGLALENVSGGSWTRRHRQAQLHPNAHSPEHVHQSIDAEEADLPSHKIAHPGLGDSEELSGLGLSEAATVDLNQSLVGARRLSQPVEELVVI